MTIMLVHLLYRQYVAKYIHREHPSQELNSKGTAHTLDSSVAETRVQSICSTVEQIGRDLLSAVIHEVDLNGPRTERKALNTRILVAITRAISTRQLNGMCL